MNKFKILSVFTSVLCLYLFYLLFFSPQSLFSDLGIKGTEASYFICRRASMLMLGISVLTFLARGIPHSQAMQAISLSVCVTMLGLAMTGTYELMRGFVSNDILISITIESTLSISFFYIWFSNRRKVVSI
ncbi:MAG: hypothetical protein GY714_28010 [Desulfobacterales bacterium]|nr:hypothetical protein [Desulfobacterales bacterium]MCP4159345.1 hypothetical protein [Deltaproteobacteria bacterium]